MADLAAIARRINDEVLSQGKLELIDELVADDFVEHQAMPGMPEGKDALRAFVEMFRAAFPDLKVETLATAVDGDEVWVHSRMTGTHKGDFNGIAPTGKKVDVTMFDRVRTRDGKAVEHWGVSDDLAMLTQLGVVPEMG
ncbi:MAG TPA: ester cyclase [Acidimicrobiia bacterium]|nr:ester cyclase [Acidimicrobiia bacterium]